MTKKIKLLEKEKVLNLFFKMNKYKISFNTINDEEISLERLCFERGDSVGVFTYDPKTNLVLLISEFRTGAYARALREEFSEEEIEDYSFSLSIIAGMFDKDLSAEETINLECEEEAGMDFENMERMYSQPLLTSPGGTSEATHMFYAEIDANEVDLEKEFGADGEGEVIKSHLLSPEELQNEINKGKIVDMKTIVAFEWFKNNKLKE